MVDATPPEVLATSTADVATGADPLGDAVHVEPELWGLLAPYQVVAVSMLVLFIIAFGWLKVHKTIARGLDGRIAAIKSQLDEAKQLRAEAEALRDEYSAKIANAEKDAEAMIANARNEADNIVARAKADTEATIARRERMAQEKIAAEERAAVAQVRARAASASAAASRRLIAEQHGADADRSLVDEAISAI